jgi:hypothetical protein
VEEHSSGSDESESDSESEEDWGGDAEDDDNAENNHLCMYVHSTPRLPSTCLADMAL